MMFKQGSTQCNCLRRAVKDISQESIESSDSIINIQRDFLSEINLVKNQSLLSNKSLSEPNIYYAVNYDDICGPWPSSDHPTYQKYDDTAIQPTLCAWKFLTVQDMHCIKQIMFDQERVQLIFEKKLSNNLILNDKSRKLYLSLVWKIFQFMRNDSYSAKGISSVLGLFHLTHRFFLSNYWRSADETFAFFRKGLDLHTLLQLPDCDMVFNFSEYDKILDMIWSVYITQLELVRLVSTPKYNLTFKMNNCGSSKKNESILKDEK